MQKVTPFLSFDGQAEQAAQFYVSLLPGSQIDRITRSPMDTPGGKTGSVLLVEFTLAGSSYIALNTPGFTFTEAVSFLITCADQAETDRLWAALTADGGTEIACGWLKDAGASSGRSHRSACWSCSAIPIRIGPAAPWRR
jgi:predicted 3-demethylubiquinone-9 3-methyltransferase (glyoxalase superfamily)|nr:VOC family protein [Prosthecobacter sp.]